MNLPWCHRSDAEFLSVSFRFGIGRFTTEEEVDYTVEKCIHHVKCLREMRYALLFQRFFGRNCNADSFLVLKLCIHPARNQSLKILGFQDLEEVLRQESGFSWLLVRK